MRDDAAVKICLMADDAAAALDFYARAFGAEEVGRRIRTEDGKIGHAEFRLGGQTFFMSGSTGSLEAIGVRSPIALGGVPLTIRLTVDDLEAVRDRAIGCGARLLPDEETGTGEGARRCRLIDPAGYVWVLVARTAMA